MIKIPDKHIWAVLQKIKEIKRHTPDGSLLRYPIDNLFDKNPPKDNLPVDEANTLYELDDWGVIKITDKERSENGMIFVLQVLPKFENETYPDYEKKFSKNKQAVSQSGLAIAEEDNQQVWIQYDTVNF